MKLTNQQILVKASDSSGERYFPGEALLLTPEGSVVSEGHPDGAVLLCGKHGSIPISLAHELGMEKPQDVQHREAIDAKDQEIEALKAENETLKQNADDQAADALKRIGDATKRAEVAEAERDTLKSQAEGMKAEIAKLKAPPVVAPAPPVEDPKPAKVKEEAVKADALK